MTTPNALHLADVLTAFANGKPVLCEKPMAMRAAECKEMVEASRRTGLLLGVAQVFRFEESTAALRRRIAEGQIGKPVFARAEFSFWHKDAKRTWLTDASVGGGGPIFDVGVHCVDALRFVLQDEVVRVSARGAWDADSGGVEAAAALTLDFASGTLGSVLISMRARISYASRVRRASGSAASGRCVDRRPADYDRVAAESQNSGERNRRELRCLRAPGGRVR